MGFFSGPAPGVGPQTHWGPQLIGQQGGRMPACLGWRRGWEPAGETSRGLRMARRWGKVGRWGPPLSDNVAGTGGLKSSNGSVLAIPLHPTPPGLDPPPARSPAGPQGAPPSLCPPETVAESCPNPASIPRCEPPLTGRSPPVAPRERSFLPKLTTTFTHLQARATTLAQLTVFHARAEPLRTAVPGRKLEKLRRTKPGTRWGRELGAGGSSQMALRAHQKQEDWVSS